MAMSGQTLSRNRPKPGCDRSSRRRGRWSAMRRTMIAGHETGLHRHPRAQLLFATAGVMRVTTEAALFTVPPGTGLWVPARYAARGAHGRRRADAGAVSAGGRGGVRPGGDDGDRGLAAAARADPDGVRGAGGVGCARADPAGGGAGAARDRPGGDADAVVAGVPRSAAGAGGGGAGCRSGRSARSGRACRGRRGLGADAGAFVPHRDRHELSAVAAAVADDRGAGSDRPGRAAGAGGGGGRLCQRAGVRGGVSETFGTTPAMVAPRR